MPTLSCSVAELPEHIFLPVIQQISHRILARLGCDIVIGDNIYIDAEWSTHSETHDKHHNATLGREQFRVEPNIQLNPSSQKWDAYTFHHTTAYGLGQRLLNNSYSIYLDKPNEVKITEMRTPVTISMECSLTVKGVDLAYQIPQRIYNQYENGAIIHFNDLYFTYPVPKPIVSVLFGLWKMDRIHGKPAGVGFVKYLKFHTNGTWEMTKNRNKNQYEVVVPVVDLKSLATLEYNDDRPSGEMEDQLPVGFTIRFNYTFQFAMPSQCILSYPVLFNNQMVPLKYIPVEKQERFNAMPEQDRLIAMDRYRNKYIPRRRNCAITPWYDTWFIPNESPANSYRQRPFLIVGLTVDEENKDLITVVDLNDLDKDPAFSLTPIVKKVLTEQGAESVKYDTIYHVALYRNDTPLLGGRDYTFDKDLKLTFKARDLNAHYRLVLCACGDLAKIHPKWYQILKENFPDINPALKDQIIQRVESISQSGGLGQLGSGITHFGPHGATDGTGTGAGQVATRPGGALIGSNVPGGIYGQVGMTDPSKPNGVAGGSFAEGLYPDLVLNGDQPGHGGIWWDPSWPPGSTIDQNGNIHDPITNEIIGNIADSKYPMYTGDQNGDAYGNHFVSRSFIYDIITRKA